MPNYEIRKYFVALIKRIVLFSITLFFIITLLISATKSYAIPYPAGAGKGTQAELISQTKDYQLQSLVKTTFTRLALPPEWTKKVKQSMVGAL